MKLEEKLKLIRKKEGLTQPEFAKIVGLSMGSYGNWEAGTKVMGSDKLLQIMTHPRFKKYASLFASDTEHEISAPDTDTIMQILNDLSNEDRKEAINFLNYLHDKRG